MRFSDFFSVNNAVRILLAYLFIVNASEGLFLPIIAVFITNTIAGATLATVGFSVVFYAVAKSVVQVPLASFIDKKKGERDDFFVLFLGAVIGVFYAFGFLLIKEPWHLFALEAWGGVGAALLMAAYYGIFARHVDKGNEGFEWSLFSVGALTVSAAIGGALGGMFADAFGFPALFVTAGVSNTVATVLLLLLYPYLDGVRKKLKPKNPRVL
ncbi:MAG: MFS transporter [Parcubacteria group bacterium]|nr:MFS transporter [Parcubacteria group bacterium]